MLFRPLSHALFALCLLSGTSSSEANTFFSSQQSPLPQEQVISTGIHCHHRLGNRLLSSPKNRKILGIDSFGAKIFRGVIENGSKLILHGRVFGYFCDLIDETPKQYGVMVDPVRDIPGLSVSIKTDHTTLFSDYRLKYFQVQFTDSYNFKIEVPIVEFFRPKQAMLLSKGQAVEGASFYVAFQFKDSKGKLIENWFFVTGDFSERDGSGLAILSKINMAGPFGRSWDY